MTLWLKISAQVLEVGKQEHDILKMLYSHSNSGKEWWIFQCQAILDKYVPQNGCFHIRKLIFYQHTLFNMNMSRSLTYTHPCHWTNVGFLWLSECFYSFSIYWIAQSNSDKSIYEHNLLSLCSLKCPSAMF